MKDPNLLDMDNLFTLIWKMPYKHIPVTKGFLSREALKDYVKYDLCYDRWYELKPVDEEETIYYVSWEEADE